MKKYLSLFLVLALLAGCSAPAEKEPAKTAETTPAAETNETEKEMTTHGTYIVNNTTGETITELYIYKTGSEDKGKNYAEGGLADGQSVTIEVEAEKEEAEGYAQTLEFINESGHVENNFQTLHLEDITINPLAEGADAYTSATPFQFVTGAN